MTSHLYYSDQKPYGKPGTAQDYYGTCDSTLAATRTGAGSFYDLSFNDRLESSAGQNQWDFSMSAKKRTVNSMSTMSRGYQIA